MKMTSAEANKTLKKLNDEYVALLSREERSKKFNAAMGENVESVRPAYEYNDVQVNLDNLERRIRKIKHVINTFNTTTMVDGFDMTVDEMLVYIPQLTKRKAKLADMSSKLPMARVEEHYGRPSNIIDYTYINYDLEVVVRDLELVTDELSKAQIALDVLNNTAIVEFEY